MHRFTQPLHLDNVFFTAALAVSAGFMADRFFEEEREKIAIAQARELRTPTLARAEQGCIARANAAAQPAANGACKPSETRQN